MTVKRVSAAIAASCLAAALMAVPTAQAAPAAGECPAVAVIAARGSDQDAAHGEYFGPQRYSESMPASNGYEGPNFTALLRLVEQRHPGTMDHVAVLALDDEDYPASMNVPPLAKEGETLSPAQMLERVIDILRTYPLGDLLYGTTFGAINSVRTGIASVPRVVEDYEASTGCHLRYVLAGYSQGAVITASAEQFLAATNRLEATLSIGNPLRHHPWVFPRAALPADRRVDYCLSGDFTCDFSLASVSDALATKAKRHASYFRQEPTAEDLAVADAFAGWVQGAVDGAGG